MSNQIRLGVNIDHVASIRNARGSNHPDPIRAAHLAAKAGVDGITAHLREDRRHICEDDITRLNLEVSLPLNLEMAATEEMLEIALHHHPHAVCVVPERRKELTTEGGLNVMQGFDHLQPIVTSLNKAGIRVSLFIDPDFEQLHAARDIEVPVIELHTGTYCDAISKSRRVTELNRLVAAAAEAKRLNLECHAGHGLTFETVGAIAAISSISELNIGHFLVGEAIFNGLDSSIHRMRALIKEARTNKQTTHNL